MFTVMSTFGTLQDITTDELRIEAFYPSDDATRAFFTQAAGANRAMLSGQAGRERRGNPHGDP